MEYYLDFSSDSGLVERNHTELVMVNTPRLEVDPLTNRQACYFDGLSGIQLPPVQIGKEPFTVEVVFRNLSDLKESGIFGSNGFRLALRTNKKTKSFTFWANFPSAIDKKSIDFSCPIDQWNAYHYVKAQRQDKSFKLWLDNQLVSELLYDYDYWSVPIYLGYYYDPIYAFVGYIREYRFRLGVHESETTTTPIPDSIG